MTPRDELTNDNSALSAAAAILLFPLIGFGGIVAVWAYEQYSGSPIFEASTGTDVESWLWIAVAALAGLLFLVFLIRWFAGSPRR